MAILFLITITSVIVEIGIFIPDLYLIKCSTLKHHLFCRNIVNNPLCTCGKPKTNEHYLFSNGALYTNARFTQCNNVALGYYYFYYYFTIWGYKSFFSKQWNNFQSSSQIYFSIKTFSNRNLSHILHPFCYFTHLAYYFFP